MKRIVDILGAVVGLVIFSPFLVVLYVLVRRDVGAPVLFRQNRPGRDGKHFKMLKFRTMREIRGADKMLLPDSERITLLGKKLRSISADELPEFWNVLTGDMSLVGPRPLLVEYLPLYSVKEARRHEVRPGVTGWAQVNGRNAISWEEKFALDIWYLDNRNFLLDLKIIWMTLGKVIFREGISASGEVTMPKFTGTK